MPFDLEELIKILDELGINWEELEKEIVESNDIGWLLNDSGKTWVRS